MAGKSFGPAIAFVIENCSTENLMFELVRLVRMHFAPIYVPSQNATFQISFRLLASQNLCGRVWTSWACQTASYCRASKTKIAELSLRRLVPN